MASLRPVGGTPAEVRALLEPWVRAGGEPIVIRTSGSTGQPKDVVLSHGAVLASATATLERLGGAGQWLLDLPVTGVAGLQVLVRSILSETREVVLAEHDSLASALAAFDPGQRRYASVVPTQLYRWAASGQLANAARFDAILVGGAAVDAGLLADARAAGVNVVRTYGMSETCGGCVYDGRPLPGVELRIDDDGQVLLRGPMLFDGYPGIPHDPSAWFATADLGEIRPDGRLRVIGRMDDVIVSGGTNIPLPAVEAAVRRLEGVADAAVVGVPDAEWGMRVVAALVPDGHRQLGLEAVRDGVEASGLARTWAPRQLLILGELPLLPAGKLDRVRLRTLAEDGR